MEMMSRSSILQFQTTKSLNTVECRNQYENSDLQQYGFDVEKIKDVLHESICTTNEEGKGLCLGDTGNPLVFQEPSGNQTLVGVSSRYIECSSKYPNVYTKVYTHLNWIHAEINN